jgi:hypothetical protein
VHLKNIGEKFELQEWKIKRDLTGIEKAKTELMAESFKISMRNSAFKAAFKDIFDKEGIIDPLKFNIFRQDGKNNLLDYSGVEPRIKPIAREKLLYIQLNLL